ncbi:MAG TPA: PepSY-like domain-containing protein [Puia sp.]|nr:PepSY-like domain-containing protein [Puia sp.]
MFKTIIPGILGVLIAHAGTAQQLKKANVPVGVQTALTQKYPGASHVVWEREKGNYEANWGGRSNEDNSALFTPDGKFVEMAVAIPVSGLPAGVAAYVGKHYAGAKISEAARVTDAKGQTTYEAEVKGKDLIFDTAGNFIKRD